MRTHQSLLVAGLVLLPLGAFALAPRATANDPTWAGGGKLGTAMQTLQAGQQKIGKALDKKDFATVLAQTLEMEKAVQEAKLDTPPTAGAVKEPDKKKEFVAGFRKQMIELQKALLDLEAAAVGENVDEAKKVFDERLKSIKKDGHGKYKGD
ncbi:MAG: hypothetical protein HZA53_07145 [Planctomycetes bacterium]|nr:hypothetical protein [Planctomycetota bacterium]